MIYWTRKANNSPKKFSNQKWFYEFEIENFIRGDVLWMEDYTGNKAEENINCGIIVHVDTNEVVLRVLSAKEQSRLSYYERDEPLVNVIGTHLERLIH